MESKLMKSGKKLTNSTRKYSNAKPKQREKIFGESIKCLKRT
jgi:hypothetical protein